jgi:hypothetical protein
VPVDDSCQTFRREGLVFVEKSDWYGKLELLARAESTSHRRTIKVCYSKSINFLGTAGFSAHREGPYAFCEDKSTKRHERSLIAFDWPIRKVAFFVKSVDVRQPESHNSACDKGWR